MEETRAFHDEVAATERWFASPRFRETARPYTPQVSSSRSTRWGGGGEAELWVARAESGTASAMEGRLGSTVA